MTCLTTHIIIHSIILSTTIGPDFKYTYHLNQYTIVNPNKTYGDLVKFWKKQKENVGKFKDKFAATGEFEYNNFVREYRKKHAGVGMKEISQAWLEHKEKRNRKCGWVRREIRKIER